MVQEGDTSLLLIGEKWSPDTPPTPQEQAVLGNGINDRAAMSQWQFHAMEAEAGISGEQVAVSALRGGTLRHD